MYIGKHADWEETEPMTWTILLVRKSFFWFLDNAIGKKDMYKSNLLGIFDKWPVVLEWHKTIGEDEAIAEQFWPYSVKEMREFVQKEDGQFFDQMKTPMAWWDPYPTSHISTHYHVFFQEDESKEIFEIDPKSSYGRFNDIQDWTLEDVKKKAADLCKEAGLPNRNVDLSMFKVNLSCILDESFYRLNWELAWFIKEDNAESVKTIRDYVTEFNNGFVKLASDWEVVAPAPAIAAPVKVEAPAASLEATEVIKPKPKPKKEAPSTKEAPKTTATGKTEEDLPW